MHFIFSLMLFKKKLFKDIAFISMASTIKDIMGEPGSIIHPRHEYGPFSEEWSGMEFYEYFYGLMNFITYQAH